MIEFLNDTHFQDLEDCNPDQVIKNTGCRYDAAARQYFVKIWGTEYIVDLAGREIKPSNTGPELYEEFLYLFIIFYLIKVQKTNPEGDWISEKDLPGGEGFFRGPHLLPVKYITDKFGYDLNKFETACKSIGGREIAYADKAYAFEITPLIPVAVLYWKGDEDFPAEAKLLFDRTIEQLPLDIIYALAVEVCYRFKSL